MAYLGAAFVLGLGRFAWKLSQLDEVCASAVVGGLIPFALLGILFFLIWSGKNWARYVYAAFLVLSSQMAGAGIREQFHVTVVGALIGIVQVLLQAVAAFALFRPEPTRWFKERSAATHSFEGQTPPTGPRRLGSSE